MDRAVKSIQAFTFQSDFRPMETGVDLVVDPQDAETDGNISLSPHELAELLSVARAEGIEEALRLRSEKEGERLAGVTNQLDGALENLVALAKHIEASGFKQEMSEASLRLINKAARRIIDGQGDLFSESQECAINHETEE